MKHTKFFSLLKLMPGADKEQIVWQASGFTTSLSDFAEKNMAGYWRMVADMERAVGANVAANGRDRACPVSTRETTDAETKRLRSAILHRLQKHGVDTTDWKRVNTFMARPQVAGKLLFEMTVDEMKALLPKLHAILKKDKAKIEADAVASASQLIINN